MFTETCTVRSWRAGRLSWLGTMLTRPAKRGSGPATKRVLPLSSSSTDRVTMLTSRGPLPMLPTVRVVVATVPGVAGMGSGGEVTKRSALGPGAAPAGRAVPRDTDRPTPRSVAKPNTILGRARHGRWRAQDGAEGSA